MKNKIYINILSALSVSKYLIILYFKNNFGVLEYGYILMIILKLIIIFF